MENKRYNYFNDFENEVKKNVPKVLPDALKQLKEPLTEYINSQSVTKDSLDLLKTNNINLEKVNDLNNMNNVLPDSGDAKDKQRVLTREIPGMNQNNSQPMSSQSFDIYNNNNNNRSIYNNGSYDNNVSSNNGNSMWGFTDTAILLSIAVLIALVFLVSTAAIMYFGLK